MYGVNNATLLACYETKYGQVLVALLQCYFLPTACTRSADKRLTMPPFNSSRDSWNPGNLRLL